MSWFRIDDVFYSHAKVQLIPRSQRAAVLGTWVFAGTWCANQRTDGVIPAHMVEELAGSLEHAELLVSVKLWRRRGRKGAVSYVFHDWAMYQPLKAEEDERRAAEAERKRLARAAAKAAGESETSGRTSGPRGDTRADDPVPSRPVPSRPVPSRPGDFTKTRSRPLRYLTARASRDGTRARSVMQRSSGCSPPVPASTWPRFAARFAPAASGRSLRPASSPCC